LLNLPFFINNKNLWYGDSQNPISDGVGWSVAETSEEWKLVWLK